jgi:hypothetical protein
MNLSSFEPPILRVALAFYMASSRTSLVRCYSSMLVTTHRPLQPRILAHVSVAPMEHDLAPA